MHVMMAIKTLGRYAVETKEFVALGRHYVLEGVSEPRVKSYPGKAMAKEVACEFVLMSREPCETMRRRKRRRQVYVEAGVDTAFPRDCCGPFGVLHEDHGTHGGNRLANEAVKGPLGCLVVPPPIISIHNEKARALVTTGCRLVGRRRIGRRIRCWSYRDLSERRRNGLCFTAENRAVCEKRVQSPHLLTSTERDHFARNWPFCPSNKRPSIAAKQR